MYSVTEQEQHLVSTFHWRRGPTGTGGPIQIRDANNDCKFEAVIPSAGTFRSSEEYGHDSRVMVASMSKSVTGIAAAMTMDIFQAFDIKIKGHAFTPDLPLHLIGFLEEEEFPDEFARLDPARKTVSIRRAKGMFWSSDVEELKEDRAITFRHLLTHTSGLSTSVYVGKSGGYINDFTYLEFQPGERFEYGAGYDVVGRCLSGIWKKYGCHLSLRSAGLECRPSKWKTLNDVVDALVFRPLRMRRSEFKSLHDYAQEDGRPLMAWLTSDKDITAKQLYGGRDLRTTGNDFANFLTMLLCRGEIPASIMRETGGLEIRDTKYIGFRPWDSRRLMNKDKFVDYVLRNQLPEPWDHTENSSVCMTHGSNGYFGMDHHFGHSFVAAVSKSTGGSPRDMFDLVRPKHGEAGTHLYWRGVTASVWHVNYDRCMSFVHVTQNPGRIGMARPRMVEGHLRKTFTVNHDWLIGPLFPLMDALTGRVAEDVSTEESADQDAPDWPDWPDFIC